MKNVVEGKYDDSDGADHNDDNFWDTVEIASKNDVVIPR